MDGYRAFYSLLRDHKEERYVECYNINIVPSLYKKLYYLLFFFSFNMCCTAGMHVRARVF